MRNRLKEIAEFECELGDPLEVVQTLESIFTGTKKKEEDKE